MPIQVKIITGEDVRASQKHGEDLDSPDAVALIGAFLDETRSRRGKFLAADCAGAVSRLPCPETFFVQGNHKGSVWRAFEEALAMVRPGQTDTGRCITLWWAMSFAQNFYLTFFELQRQNEN